MLLDHDWHILEMYAAWEKKNKNKKQVVEEKEKGRPAC